MSNPRAFLFYLFTIPLIVYFSCSHNSGDGSKNLFQDSNIANLEVEKFISAKLQSLELSEGLINDSVKLKNFKVVKEFYMKNKFKPLWCDSLKWLDKTEDFFNYLDTSVRDGLFVEDYNYNAIQKYYLQTINDSLYKLSLSVWADADILMTDALIRVLRDLKQGRLQDDSLCWENIPGKYDYFFDQIKRIEKGEKLQKVFNDAQPQYSDYYNLKNGIKKFVDSISGKKFTYLKFPFKKDDPNDSLLFIERLHTRLIEEGFTKYSDLKIPDSVRLAEELNWYRKKKNLSDQKIITLSLIKLLNFTDDEKLLRIALTLDKYKQLNTILPSKYICVNLPGYHLRVRENDSTILYSKVICGKPSTRTPLLSSTINEIITYPTWTVPSSIISKEMLPGLKKNNDYLNRKGLYLLDKNGVRVNPGEIDWSIYKRSIPFKIQQGSGDNNALGVIKFNFPNEHSVYLHDTNQRHLFAKNNRALSHGCVRVQEWKNLALFLIRNDSMNLSSGSSLYCNSDSLENWIAKKQKHKIPIINKMPIFIWYYTCEGIDGKISFYSDIYDEDKILRDKYFAIN